MAFANPPTQGLEYESHIGNPTRHIAVDVSSADVDLTDNSHLGAAACALWSGTGGTIVAKMSDNTSATYTNVPAGSYLVGCFCGVVHSGTTATGIIALR